MNPFLQEVSWRQIREEVWRVAPELAEIIDRLDPSANHKLIKASYAYGERIVNKGQLCLPSLPDKSPCEITNQLAQRLGYSQIPLFLTLDKANEVFVDTGPRAIPLNLFKPGSLLGLFESIDYSFDVEAKPSWSVSAGARSIILLAKITENSGLRRLRAAFDLPVSLSLNDLSDQAQLFATIAQHSKFTQEWRSSVLFFTKAWFKDYLHDPAWFELHRYFFKQGWQQAKFAISRVELSLGWETFVDAISSRKLKPTPYIADQVKHILSVAAGRAPGFRPNDQSQLVAPTLGLQQVFTDVYQLKKYWPTFMHPHTFNNEDGLATYYSLFFSTVLEGSPHNESSTTIMLDLRDIKLLLDTAFQRIVDARSRFNTIIKNTNFEYFHVESDKFSEVQSSKLIPDRDLAFHEAAMVHDHEYGFCSTSAFWRGCVRISSY